MNVVHTARLACSRPNASARARHTTVATAVTKAWPVASRVSGAGMIGATPSSPDEHRPDGGGVSRRVLPGSLYLRGKAPSTRRRQESVAFGAVGDAVRTP